MSRDIAKILREYKELLDDDIITREEYEEKKKELLGEEDYRAEYDNARISNKVTGIVAYIGWIGFLVAILLGDYRSNPFHVNQALLVHLFSLLAIIPVLGWIWGFVMLVFWIMGLDYAAIESKGEAWNTKRSL